MTALGTKGSSLALQDGGKQCGLCIPCHLNTYHRFQRQYALYLIYEQNHHYLRRVHLYLFCMNSLGFLPIVLSETEAVQSTTLQLGDCLDWLKRRQLTVLISRSANVGGGTDKEGCFLTSALSSKKPSRDSGTKSRKGDLNCHSLCKRCSREAYQKVLSHCELFHLVLATEGNWMEGLGAKEPSSL